MALTKAYPTGDGGFTQVYGIHYTLNGNESATWINFVSEYAQPPVFVASIPDGRVYRYTYSNFEAYRLVPSNPNLLDSFYSTFIDNTLGTLLVHRC